MARRTKDAPSGRVTPKGGSAKSRPSASNRGRPASGRYTAPIPVEYRESSWLVPALMLTFFGLGLICIVLNYVGVLPGGTSNVYLFVGLALIVAGFITATRWH
jgi:hypothetical protein